MQFKWCRKVTSSLLCLRIGSAHRTECNSVIIDRKIPLKYSDLLLISDIRKKMDSFSTNFSLLYDLRYGLFDTSLNFSMALLYIYGTVNAFKNTYEVLNQHLLNHYATELSLNTARLFHIANSTYSFKDVLLCTKQQLRASTQQIVTFNRLWGYSTKPIIYHGRALITKRFSKQICRPILRVLMRDFFDDLLCSNLLSTMLSVVVNVNNKNHWRIAYINTPIKVEYATSPV